MSTRSTLPVLAGAGAIVICITQSARAQIECWAPGMTAPVTITETTRSVTGTIPGKPFRYDIFGVAGKLELGNKANNASLVNNIFKEKLLGGLLGTGGSVQSASYVMLQTGLTNFYPEKLYVSGWSPAVNVGPVYQYGQNWTLSDPQHPATVSLTFHTAGSSLLGSLLPGLLSPANYNLNPKGYFYVLGEYHAAPPVMTGTLTASSDQVLSGLPVNVSYQISRYDTPIYRPPFLGLDLANIGLTVIGTPPQTSVSTPAPGAAPAVSTGKSTDLYVTLNLLASQGQGWLKISNTP